MSEQIVVIGDALIDEIRDERGVREFVGGAALNVAVGLARLGHATTLLAMVGADAAGERIRAYLATFGVELIATPSATGTARAVSERANGEPVYTFNTAARGRRIVFGVDERAAIAQARAVVVSCMALDDAAQVDELVDALRGSRAPLFIDPNPRSGMLRNRDDFVRGFDALLSRSALVKIGDDDAALLFDAPLESARGWLTRRGVPVVVSTMGSQGARIDAGDDVVSRGIATLSGAVVDTMGAGDAVLASIVSSALTFGREADWGVALERAMNIAAATVRREGALLQIPAQPGENYDRIDT